VLLAGGCAAPVKEVAGPAHAQPMANDEGFGAEYVTTSRREGARQPFLLLRPAHPVASLILFPGGDGVVEISPAGIRHRGNLLVRTRKLFARQGFVVALVDPPSDRRDLYGFRTSEAHALDIKGVIAFLREQTPVPVWLVGTSYGTVSAIKVADRLADAGGPDGVVLTSSIFVPGKLGDSVYDADPSRIRVPLLLVHHRNDRCRSTPFPEAEPYLKRMANAHPAELIAFEGGGPGRGAFCEQLDYHGFPGLEDQVVAAIARWIKGHPPAQ
jgi:pimeloyl-ACP methyl ester carboxylesterase